MTYDQTVNIIDAIFMLDYLFTGGAPCVSRCGRYQ